MRGLPKRETAIGWVFAAVGYFLIHWHRLAIDDLLHARALSILLFPSYLAAQYFFMGFFILALLAAAGLLFVTGWGVGHRRSWSRWTGLMPCLYLMCGFPYLTAVGAAGLWYLWTQPIEERAPLTASEYWNPRRQSGWMLTASLLGWFVARLLFGVLQVRAYRDGLPPLDPAGPGFIPFIILMLWHIAIHECGHAMAANIVGFRVKVLAIGPVVIEQSSAGYSTRFNWRGLFLLGGYMGAAPGSSARRFRLRQMIVIAAGPATSLAAGAILLAVFYQLPGTALADLWQEVAMGSVAGFYIGLVNLLPFGYSDGTMLWHLGLRTRRGEELLALLLRGRTPSAEPTCEDQIAARRQALQALLDSADADPVKVGEHYIALGAAELTAQHLRDAERHLLQGLDLLPEGVSVSHAAYAWECLQILRAYRFDPAGADHAYRKALDILVPMAAASSDPGERLRVIGLHVRAHAWETALREIAEVLSTSLGDELRGAALRWSAEVLLQTGHLEAGMRDAQMATAIFRTHTAGGTRAHRLAWLGGALREAGRTEEALGLLTESIVLLEAQGPNPLAVSFRLYLAEVLRTDGQVSRAACVLPRRELVPEHQLAAYYRRRGEIRLSGGKASYAIRDLTRHVAICEAEATDDPVSVAAACVPLAEALVAAGDMDHSERVAREACKVLAPIGHPAFPCACITLAITGSGEWVDTAIHAWESDPFLLPFYKILGLETAASRLEAAGMAAEAERCRTAAERQRGSLVLTTSN
jgi:tetratricopeptide (TPR) repeat protein